MSLLLQYTLIFASVLILVALGGCFSEHSGVINLGLEGIMIMGALGGALTMRYLGENSSHFVTILAVVLVSAAVGMVYSCCWLWPVQLQGRSDVGRHSFEPAGHRWGHRHCQGHQHCGQSR